jgi:cytosine/adenosine deaminase-related metal-dependent hydrolase
MLHQGVTVGLGTDGPMSSNSLDLWPVMGCAASIHKLTAHDVTVMPPKQVLNLATLGGAKALGLEDRIGSLEVGKLADVVIVDGKTPNMIPSFDVYATLVHAANAGNVRTTIVNGRIISETVWKTAKDL